MTKLKHEPKFHTSSHLYGFTTAAFARLFRSHNKPTLERSERPAELQLLECSTYTWFTFPDWKTYTDKHNTPTHSSPAVNQAALPVKQHANKRKVKKSSEKTNLSTCRQLFGSMTSQMNCGERLRLKSLSRLCTHSHTHTPRVSYTPKLLVTSSENSTAP